MDVDAIHVGLPKCASNLLQRHLFKRHPEIVALVPKFEPELRPLWERLIAFSYDLDERSLLSRLESSADKQTGEKKEGAKCVLSQEGLTGGMVDALNGKAYTDLLFSLFGRVRILVVIREQYSYTGSVYRHLVRGGEVFSVSRFVEQAGSLKMQGLIGNGKANLFERLQYHKMVSYYHKVFGKENVKIVPYELLSRDFSLFTRELWDFLDVAPVRAERATFNRGGTIPVLQTWLNFFSRTPFNNGKFALLPAVTCKIFRKLFLRIPSTGPRKEHVRKCFPGYAVSWISESNKQLEELIERDLGQYGYDV